MKIDINPIAYVRSCYKEKFATPRQPGLVPAAQGEIELIAPYNDPLAVEGLHECSHIWLQFVFHQCLNQDWKAKVRPPRLGGNKKMGVFATRATHRPNALGLSVVKLDKIDTNHGAVILHVSGLDLIDGTPILDIKPYIPYSDCIEGAHYPFAQQAPSAIEVMFDDALNIEKEPKLHDLLVQVLSQDPKPAFHKIDSQRIYGAHLADFNVQWVYETTQNSYRIRVIQIDPA
ncbi:tRNA (N6-threonylcarbamoyladenosine(37)-N6)-methyltransferase TrmO [Oceaniserpentilla sp. 4NH20-0058]|uniref:tRNA (N6-threonylcarbamoyladenosine(37)-N6)-methyltransferase TrmO n=1 Tax=Oceaniserpentilla sp. 4NH20-0058 TaxID=3127660 RepID=UPI003105EEBF